MIGSPLERSWITFGSPTDHPWTPPPLDLPWITAGSPLGRTWITLGSLVICISFNTFSFLHGSRYYVHVAAKHTSARTRYKVRSERYIPRAVYTGPTPSPPFYPLSILGRSQTGLLFRSRVDPGLLLDRSRIDSGSIQGRFRVDPGSLLDRSRVGSWVSTRYSTRAYLSHRRLIQHTDPRR